MAKKTFVLFLLLAAALCASCTPPQVLIAQGFAGERVVRYTIQNNGAGDDDSGELFDLRIRLCNQGEDGSDQDCKDSMLLQNVKPKSVY